MAGRQSSPARAHATGRLQHTPSHEILTSHPLLSPGSSSSHESSSSGQGNGSNSPRASSSILSSNSALGLNNHQQSTATSTSNVRAGASSPGTPPKYLPYTPRQARSAMATTGTASSPVSGSISASPLHQQHQQQNPSYATGSNGAVTISATSRLQLQNLKAVAQNYGLDAGSVGWAMIEEIIGVRSDHSHSQLQAAAWAEIWNVITTGKATLLLPTDQYQANTHESITPEFVKDHVIFCNGPSRECAPIVTSSGLRGQIDENTLTIQSTLPTSSKPFKLLLDPATRPSTLLSLPPLPVLPTSPSATPTSVASVGSLNSHIGYPRVQAYRYIPAIPLPPRSSQQQKPPLPPRPGANPNAKTLSTSSNVSRLSNPFASLFGSRSSSTPISSPSSTPISLSSPHAHPLDTTGGSSDKNAEKPKDIDKEKDHVIEVSAFTIAHPIIRKDIIKGMGKCFKSQIRSALADSDVGTVSPSWVVDRTLDFCKNLLSSVGSVPRRPVEVSKRSDHNSVLSVMSLSDEEDPSEVVQAFQVFYESLENELRSKIEEDKRKEKDRGKEKLGEEEAKEKLEKEKEDREKRIQGVIERVEQVLTSLFYDRLFRPSNSDDASHDEALSSRIAALNMLDLSLDHLGVDAGKSAEDVNRVVEACGETITQLEVARSPADKAAILVAAHRIIVDGLSRLPPLKLKGEEEQSLIIDEDKTPQAPSFDKEVHSSLEGFDSNLDKKGDGDNSPPKLTVSPGPASPESEKAGLIPESSTSETIKPSIESSAQDSPPASPVPSFTLSPADEEAPVPLPVPDEDPGSSLLTISPPATQTPTPVSGDILLPLLIFSVVKSNPPMLPSHLLYTQRYRNPMYSGVYGGEESYCLINLMAVIEFLENVDLEALGLGGGEKVMSTADLSPIPVLPKDLSAASTPGGPAGLRGRVEQQVDAIAGSANKVLSGVVGSGFGVLRALLPGDASAGLGTGTGGTAGGEAEGSAPWNIRPGFGLLRRESGFSIASLAASLPGRERARSFASSYHTGAGAEEGQEMVESRPGSVHNLALSDAEYGEEDEQEGEDGGEEERDSEEEEHEGYSHGHDARSIRSFESMMSDRSRSRGRLTVEIGGTSAGQKRMSLTDRLAHMSRLTKGSGGFLSHEISSSPSQEPTGSPARVTNPLVATNRFDTPVSSRTSSPVPGSLPASRPTIPHPQMSSPSTQLPTLPKPNKRFLECSADDLKMSEIPELLAEYRKLVDSARLLGVLDTDE